MPQKPFVPVKKLRVLTKHTCANTTQCKVLHTASQTDTQKFQTAILGPKHKSLNSLLKHSASQTETNRNFQVCAPFKSEDGVNFINTYGQINREILETYNKAVDCVNYWNEKMNVYLKSNIKYDKGDGFNIFGLLQLTSVPNSMAFFGALLQAVQDSWLNTGKCTIQSSEIKHNSSQTTLSTQNKIQQTNIKWNFGYNSSRVRTRNMRKSPVSTDKASITTETLEDTKDWILTESPILSRVSISKSHSCQGNENCNICKYHQKKNQRPPVDDFQRNEILTSNKKKQTVFERPATTVHKLNLRKDSTNSKNKFQGVMSHKGLKNTSISQNTAIFRMLSPNSMAASQINTNGTPITVKNMFEDLKCDRKTGNIFYNLSKTASASKGDESDESYIPTDDDFCSSPKKTNSALRRITTSQYSLHNVCSKNNIQLITLTVNSEDPHPLHLNDRDLNLVDKEVINSIGIFNEKGKIKPGVKQYLEKNEVRKGLFRTPRINRIHMTKDFSLKSCTSDSIVSDMLSSNIRPKFYFKEE